MAGDVYARAAARRPRRLELVHGLGRLDVSRRHREHPRPAAARRHLQHRSLHSVVVARVPDLVASRRDALRDHRAQPGSRLPRRRVCVIGWPRGRGGRTSRSISTAQRTRYTSCWALGRDQPMNWRQTEDPYEKRLAEPVHGETHSAAPNGWLPASVTRDFLKGYDTSRCRVRGGAGPCARTSPVAGNRLHQGRHDRTRPDLRDRSRPYIPLAPSDCPFRHSATHHRQYAAGVISAHVRARSR